jgi:hypothetical protein
MEKIRKMLEDKDLVLTGWEKVPGICVMREFLPQNLREYAKSVPGNGVDLEFNNSKCAPASSRPSSGCRELAANKVNTSSPVNNLLMYSCDIRPDIAQEIRGLLWK